MKNQRQEHKIALESAKSNFDIVDQQLKDLVSSYNADEKDLANDFKASKTYLEQELSQSLKENRKQFFKDHYAILSDESLSSVQRIEIHEALDQFNEERVELIENAYKEKIDLLKVENQEAYDSIRDPYEKNYQMQSKSIQKFQK